MAIGSSGRPGWMRMVALLSGDVVSFERAQRAYPVS